jgi:hypothetical protein
VGNGQNIAAATVAYASGEMWCNVHGPIRGVVKKRIGSTSSGRLSGDGAIVDLTVVKFCTGGCDKRT